MHSYCLLGNHYHLLVEIGDEGTLSPGMQWLNGVYAMSFNRRHGYVGHLFQGRFKSREITSDEDLLRTDLYIVWNPVKHGFCQSPADWPWSSFHGLVPTPRILRLFHPDPVVAVPMYRRFVLGPFYSGP